MSDAEIKAQRRGMAVAIFHMMAPHLLFDPGLGKPPMEFKRGSIDALRARLETFIETGVMPKETP